MKHNIQLEGYFCNKWSVYSTSIRSESWSENLSKITLNLSSLPENTQFDFFCYIICFWPLISLLDLKRYCCTNLNGIYLWCQGNIGIEKGSVCHPSKLFSHSRQTFLLLNHIFLKKEFKNFASRLEWLNMKQSFHTEKCG